MSHDRLIKSLREKGDPLSVEAADEIFRLKLELRGVIQTLAETSRNLYTYSTNLYKAFPDKD